MERQREDWDMSKRMSKLSLFVYVCGRGSGRGGGRKTLVVYINDLFIGEKRFLDWLSTKRAIEWQSLHWRLELCKNVGAKINEN